MIRLRERSGTHSTTEAFLSRVHSQMHLKQSWSTKGFGTLGTSKGFITTRNPMLNSQMVLQIDWKTE